MPRVTITIPDKVPQPYRFPLDRNVIALGRGSRNDIVIDCPSVSVHHAELRHHDAGFELKDLGSTNGIKLAGERRDLIPLHHGSLVKLGDVELGFELSDEEIDTLGLEKPHPSLPPLPDAPADDSAPVEAADDAQPADAACACGCSAGRLIRLLVLTLLAFAAGMALRHQQDTGESWLDTLRGRFAAPAAAPDK
jgi:hypothetical protein